MPDKGYDYGSRDYRFRSPYGESYHPYQREKTPSPVKKAVLGLLLGAIIGGGVYEEKRIGVAGQALENLRKFVSPAKTLVQELPKNEREISGVKISLPKTPTVEEVQVKPTATKTPEPTATPAPEFTSEFLGSTGINFNNEGIPISYQQEGKIINFNEEEIKRFKEIKAQAITSQEPEIALMIPQPQKESPPSSQETLQRLKASKEHPFKETISADVLSEKDLEERGIKIIQTDKVKLHIRPGAFAEGELLDNYKPGGERRLTIVLVDGGTTASIHLKDSRYDEVRSLLAERGIQIEQYKKGTIQLFKGLIEEVGDNLKKAIQDRNQEEITLYQDVLRSYKSDLYQHEKLLSEEQWLMSAEGITGSAGGVYCAKGVVFLAVGENRFPTDFLEVAVNPQGNFETRRVTIGEVGVLSLSAKPRPEQAFPNPATFSFNQAATADKPWSYPYSFQTTGQALRHELQHNVFNYTAPENFTSEGLKKYMDSKGEYNTDIKAMESIRRAWEEWEKSGYKNDEGFYFVWEIPEGFIYTVAETANQEIAKIT